jgi:hypothetical protein
MSTKSDINWVLKAPRFQIQNLSQANRDLYSRPTLWLNSEGKRVRGIRAKSCGPFDTNLLGHDKVKEKLNDIVEALRDLGFPRLNGTEFIVNETAKSVEILSFVATTIRTHTNTANYDTAYETTWLVPTYRKEKK